MEKRQKQELSEKDGLTISGKALPIDLFISIFSRLPVKSIARSRCVSKQWASILLRRDFTDLFMKLSKARPCLLIALELNGNFLFFSVPQPLNPDQNTSHLVADRHMSFPTEDSYFGISSPVCGWLCTKDKNPIVCNPSTGQYITLPKVSPPPGLKVDNYLGYDPIDKLFKVLHVLNGTYRVLTLETGELSWRMIECSIPHRPLPDGMCINGVLYYFARGINGNKVDMLVCFNVKLETFTLIDVDNRVCRSTLINFNGKLGLVLPGSIGLFLPRTTGSICLYTQITKSLELWVLEDVENKKWSKHIYVLPPLWKDIVGNTPLLYIVGMTGTGEFVFAPYNDLRGPYIVFYNVVRNTVVRVEIQLGVVASKGQKICIFVEHAEDVKLMDVVMN